MPSYPTFLNGMVVQLPYATRKEFLTRKTVSVDGYQTGVPLRTTAITSWDISYEFTDAEWATLRTFFLARNGRTESFDFTDPETTTNYPVCHFSDDDLAARHINRNRVAVTVRIEAY